MEENLNYQQALEELKGIISELETGEVSIDELTAKIHRANFLLSTCKSILFRTEKEVNQALDGSTAES